MAYEIDPKEHFELLAEVKQINKRLDKGDISFTEIRTSLKQLEERADKNDIEHAIFKSLPGEVAKVNGKLDQIIKGTLIMDPKTAHENGMPFINQLFKNPQYLMWLILAVVIIAMIMAGYSFAEISQVLQKIK